MASPSGLAPSSRRGRRSGRAPRSGLSPRRGRRAPRSPRSPRSPSPVVVALAQLRRRALFEFLDAQRQNAQNVLVEALLALHFGDRRRRGVDVHQCEMGLAVLLDPVGEGLDAPIFDLADGSTQRGDYGLELPGQRFRLLRRNILTGKKDMLVESHVLLAFP